MAEHTPGPWKALHRHVRGKHTDEVNGLGWDIFGPPEPMLRGQFARAADAHLVAAAPELLAACEKWRLLTRAAKALKAHDLDLAAELWLLREEMRAAVRKAKGEADG